MNYVADTPDPFLIVLVAIGAIGIVAIFYLWRRRFGKPPARPDADASGASIRARPALSPLQQRAALLLDLARIIIIIAAIVSALGLLLTALPQTAVEAMAGRIKAIRGVNEPEKIALLYLGDEFNLGQYRIRAVIRNISGAPLGQIDAVVRLYDRNRTLLEAVIVRLDKDSLEPDALARLDLTVPPSAGGRFAGYAVEFKLRAGDIVPYKDLRAAAASRP